MAASWSYGTGAVVTYALALILGFIHVVSFLIIIVRASSNSDLQRRSVPLLLLSILVSFALCNFLLLRDAVQFAAACRVNFWLSTVALPVWVLVVLLRALHLFVQQRSNQKRMDKLRAAIVRQQRDTALFKRSSRMSLGLDLLTEEAEKQGIAWHDILQHSTTGSSTYVAKRRFLCVDMSWLMPCVLVAMLMGHLVLAYSITRLSDNLDGSGTFAKCMTASKWEYMPAHGAALLYGLLAAPTLVFVVHRITNAYHMQVEIVIAYASTLFMLITEAFIAHVLHPVDLLAYASIWPTGLLSVLFVLPAVMTFCFYPAWQAWRGTCKVAPMQDAKPPKVPKADPAMIRLLEVFLSDSRNMRAFKEFSVRDYSVESVLFYSRIQKLKQQVASKAGLDVYAYEQSIYDLYETFIRRGAKFELNLEPRIRTDIFNRLENGDLGLDIYDAAYEETLQLIWRNVWPRFAAEQREKQTLRKHSYESAVFLASAAVCGEEEEGECVAV